MVIGLAVGLVAGRWWALTLPAAFSLYVAVVSEAEIPPLLHGVLLGLFGAAGVAAGVLIRRFANRKARPS